MTNEEAIKRLKSDIYKYSDFTENPNENEFWTAFDMAIKALEQQPCENATLKDIFCMGCEYKEQEPKTGHWSRKTKVDAYDIAGVKTWGIKCQCDKCDFTTIVVEDFGYYKYCPNCGARMAESEEGYEKQESEVQK